MPDKSKIIRNSGFFALLVLFWLLLSGHYDLLLLGLGTASVLLTYFLSRRMDIIDHESYPLQLSPRLIRFWLFLSREIVVANIDVVRRILSPKRCISPQMISLPLPQRTDLGRVIYANSITLTPGTVSVQLSGDTLKVHALSKETAEDLISERMARSVPEDHSLNLKESSS